MVDIIKSEELSLDDIKSRIVSLDSRFQQGMIGFTDRDGAYDSLSGRYVAKGINLFTNLLTQVLGTYMIFPYYCAIINKDEQSAKPARDVLQTIEEYCKELLSSHISADLKRDLRRFCEDVYDARVYSSLNSEIEFSNNAHVNNKYYTYDVKSERKNKSTLLHVYLTETPFTKRKCSADNFNYVSHVEGLLEDTYKYRVKRLTHSEHSQRILAEFDEIAALIEQFLDKFQEYAQAVIDRAHSYKSVPSIKDEYLLTVEIDAFEHDKLTGVSELAISAKMEPRDLLDITDSFNKSVYGFIYPLRNRINVYKAINAYTLFDGQGTTKKCKNGEMSIIQAKEYAKEHDLGEINNRELNSYVSGRLENIDDLLYGTKKYNAKVYAELTRFKTKATNMLKDAFLNTYALTLKELQYSYDGEYGLEKHINALAQGRETQEELNNLIGKWESDIDEIETLMKRIQEEFDKCLARCAKLIEGEK